MMYSAVVKERETKQTILIENKDYPTKSQFIEDLKNNGYTVNPYKVKESAVFEYIIKHTNCELIEWKYINRIPAEDESISDWIEEGLKREHEKQTIKFDKFIEESKNKHQEFLKEIGMTEEEFKNHMNNR
jgi:hypothetical protein